MIRIDGIEIKLEGSFKTLMEEVARAVHAVAKAASDEFEGPSEGEVTYDHVMEMVLDDVMKYKKMDNGHLPGIPEEVIDEFYESLQDLRDSDNSNPRESFIDFDTSRPNKAKNRSMVQGIIKDVFTDERSGELDIDDLKAIKAAQKKNKKKD